MGAIHIPEAAAEGFAVIRRRPLSVLAWGAVRVGFSIVVLALMCPFYLRLIGDALARAHGGVTSPPDLSSILAMQGASWLVSLVGMIVGSIVYCAVVRAVLRPEDGRLAYLRLGSAELFLFLLLFGGTIVLTVAIVILMIPVMIVVFLVAALHAKFAAVLIAIVAGASLLWLLAWVACRISLVGPMIVEDGKFHLTDAWALSRGHAVDLFLIWLCLFLILMIAEMALAVASIGLGLLFVSQAAGGFAAIPSLFAQPPMAILTKLAPALVIVGLLSIPVTGCVMAIVAAPWARAYRDLTLPQPSPTTA